MVALFPSFRRLRFLVFTASGRQYLPEQLLRPGHWLWAIALGGLALALVPSTSPLGLGLSLLLFYLVFRLSLTVAWRGGQRLRPLIFPTLLLLSLLPLALVLIYIGIFTEPYFFSKKRLKRTLRGTNHVTFRPPRGIRTDPVLVAFLIGTLILLASSKLVRTTPASRNDKYVSENWDIGRWENVEVLGDDHNDAAAEFYLDRASSAIRITFTTPVLDYYLERLIQFDEGVHWWFPDRPPLFYSEKPFRASCWGGLPRYAPRDLYFVDPTGPAPQYHPRGGYHPLWVNRQAALMLGKQPLPEIRLGSRRPLWLLSDPAAPLSRFVPSSARQRQQRLLARIEQDEEFRERIEKILGRFRSRETSMNAMQHYLYHPDAQGERDHRHMRIREHLDEQDELDRMADAYVAADEENQEYLYGCSFDDWEDELEEFDEELEEDLNAIPVLVRKPQPYSLYELRAFVPYPTAPNYGA